MKKHKLDELYTILPFGIWDNEKVGYHKPEQYHGFIYRIENKSNGMFYIGKKEYSGNWKTYTSSSKVVNEAIAEEGFDNFTFEILSLHKSETTMVLAERGLINSAKLLEFDSTYNIN